MTGFLKKTIAKTKAFIGRAVKASAAAGLLLTGVAAAPTAWATTFTETVPNGNGPIPNTYPPVGGTMFVLIGANGNIYYQFVNPSTQFIGFAGTGTPVAFRGIPTFQLGPTQALNCGSVSCNAYFGGSIVEGYARLTVRDADACPGNFDHQDVSFEVNGLPVSSLSDLAPNSVERTNFAGTTTIGTEDCFRNQGSTETSTGWFDLPGPVLTDILASGGTTPFITDTDTGSNSTRGDNFWFFTDGNDATGTPEVAPGITIEKTADRSNYTAVGDVINYEFEVTNIGSVLLTNIVVDDSFITGAVTCPQTSLTPGNINGTPPGESMICTGQHIVTQQNLDDNVVFVNTAEVTGVPTEGTLGSVSGTLSIPGPDVEPTYTISKSADKTTDAEVGDIITYTYVVENTGVLTINSVSVSDVHSGSGVLSAITPATANLAPGDSQTFTSTYEITQADFDAGIAVTNTAEPSGTPSRGTLNTPSADAQVEMARPTPEATFSKLASPDADLDVGDTVTYTYTAENTGNVTLNNVSVSDAHGGSGSLSTITPATATIAPGGSQVFTATYVITQADFDAGVDIANTATLSATPAAGTLANLTADETVSTNSPQPDSTLTKTASNDTGVVVGEVITYTYVFTNTGNTTLTAISLFDEHFGYGSLGPITPASVASLAPGASVTFTADYTVTQGDVDSGAPIINEVVAFATSPGTFVEPTATESIDPIAADPQLKMRKTADVTTDVAAGDVITYTYQVANAGNVTMNAVSISDVHSGTGTLSAITPASVNLDPGDVQSFTATYTVTQADVDAGTDITNVATANATPASGTYTPITDDAVVTVEAPSPDSTLVKTADVTTGAAVGTVVTYSYEFTNTGNVTLSAVSISDVHSGAGTLSPITPASVTLNPGQSQTFTATYTVTQADIDAGTDLTNTATSAATPAGGTYTPATDDETVELEAPSPDSTLVKTADVTTGAAVGTVVTYSYEFTNTGNVTLSAVSISDVHSGTGTLSPITPASVTLNPGQSQTFTSTYTVTQADIDAGTDLTNTATSAATPAGGTYTPATDDETVELEAPAPDSTLVKTADVTTGAAVGTVVTYSYAFTNTGNVTLSAVSISDVHSGAGTLSPITPASVTLNPGQSQTFTSTYTVTQADIDAGTDLTNTATSAASPASGTYTPATDDETVELETPAPDMTLVKTASDTTDVAVGAVITYSYDVENTGNVTMTAVSISDAHSGSGTLSAATPASVDLDPGDTQTFTATYTVTQADIDAGTDITNTATANGTPASGTYTPATDDETVTVETPDPMLTLAKSASDTTDVAVGAIITYSYLVENTGNVGISSVSVTDVHSGTGTLSAITPANVTLAPGQSQTFTATYTVTQADVDAAADLTNIATADGTPTGGTLTPATDDETVTVEAPSPDSTLVKTADVTTGAAVGTVVTYSYEFTNTGNVTLSAVSISDVHSGAGTLSPITPASVTLNPGQSQTFTATYTVTQADIDAGTDLINTATANATPASGTYTPITDDAVVTVEAPAPDSTLTKIASNDTDVVSGEVVTYTYEFTNTGNTTLTAISISDVHGGTAPLSPITPASIASLAPGASATFTSTYSVSQTDIDDGGTISNTATASATTPGTFVEPTATETIDPIAPSPALTLEKTASDTTGVAAGAVITYTYEVQNTGNVSMMAVTISDVHSGTGTLSAITPASADLDIGDSVTFTATYTVTQADIDAGTDITNVATANATPAGGTYTPITDDETVELEAPAPDSTLVKTADVTTGAAVGTVVTYSYEFTNIGNVTLSAVSISDVHSGAGTLSPITPASVTLNPGQSQTFTATYTVTQADIDAGTDLINTATSAATPASGTYTPATDDETVELETPAPDSTLVKTADVTTGAAVGTVVTYSYAFTNTGNVTLSAVSISDVHSGAGTLSPITPASVTLNPGDSQTFTATYTVTQADIDAGTDLTNTATSAATPASGTYTPATDDETVELEAPAPALEIEKTADVTSGLAVGDTVTYTYAVLNSGNVTMTGVSISDVHQGTGTLSPVTPASVNLNPGDTQNFTATYIVTQADIDAGTAITNTATANGTPAGGSYTPVSDSESVLPNTPNPAIDLSKVADVTTGLQVGDVVTYTYTALNAGSITLTNVSISDVHSGTGTLSAITPANVATLAVGASVDFTATYTVTQADVDAGAPITNTATAAATPASGTYVPATADESVTPEAPAPDSTLVKTADVTTGAAVGTVVTYSYEFTNTGNVTLSAVSISDVHSGTGTLSPITPASVTLNPGQSQTFTSTYTVTQADIDAGTDLTNTATSAATPAGGTYTPATDDETVELEAPAPDSTLVKTADVTTGAAVGTVVTYSYAFTNTGNVTLSAVSISDVHSGAGTLSPITPASVTLNPGQSQTFTATYTVTQADIDAGTDLTNTATSAASPASGTYTPATDDETVELETPAPDMTLVKTASDTTDVAVGAVITYSYDVENTGNVTMTAVSISDAHSGSGTLSAATPASVDLDPGDTQTFTATYTVTQADIDAGTDITNTATANGTPASGTYTPATDDETVTVETPDPMLTLAKSASDTTDVAVGAIITYSYLVENTGNVGISSVSVTDVHSGTGTLSAITPANVTLAPGQSQTFTATYTVTQADVDAAADLTNIATADGTPTGGTLTPATDDETVTVEAPSPDSTLVKTADVTTGAAVGTVVTYSYEFTNTGNVTLSAVSISDVHSGAGTLSPITPASVTLNPGQSQTFTATYTVTQADIDAGTPITNTATSAATLAGGTYTPVTDDETVTPEAFAPELSIAKRALDTDFAAVGDVLSYEYDVENTGNVTINALSVSDDKIASVSCPVTTLAPSAATTCTGTYTVTQADLNAGSVTNIATANGTPEGGTLTPPTDTATVGGTQSPALDIVKTALDTDFTAVGDVLSYDYDVTNTGNVTITAPITVTDNLIPNVVCPPLTAGVLLPGDTLTCSGNYTVTQADLDAGSVTNIASASDGTTTSPTDDATVGGTQSPMLELVKTALDTNFAAVGDTLDYEFEVTNTGNVEVTSLVVTDDKIASVSCPVTTLAPTQSTVCTATYSVTQADLDVGSVTNNADANGTPAGGTLPPAEDTATVGGTQSPALDIVKTALDTDFTAVGDVLSYDYDVTNTGNVTITAPITVTDNLIPNVVCPPLTAGVLLPGDTLTCSGNYTVTQADLDAGSVTNIASASDGTTTSPTDDATVGGTQSPMLELVKTALDTNFAAVGDTLDYEFEVTNTGNVEVTSLVVTDDKIASVSCPVTTLAPTQSTVCTATYSVTQADLDVGSVTNNADANGTPAGGTLPPAEDTATVGGTQSPALDIVKTALDTDFTAVGDVLSYDYDVTNTGNVTITAPITVTDNLIPNVVCPPLTAGVLLPGDTLTCSGNYTVTQADLDAGSVTNIASASDGTTTSPTDDATVGGTQNPSMTLVKTPLEADFNAVGDLLNYEYEVTNTGNVLIANLVVTDNLISNIVCPVPTIGNGDANLDPAETVICTGVYTVTQADLDAGSVTNTASATGDPSGGTLTDPVTDATVDADQTPSLTLAKAPLETSFDAVGDVLNYTYTVENTGNVLVSNLVVTDDKIAAITCNVPAIGNNDANLDVGETVICTGAYTVTQADIDAGSVTNNAEAAATPPGGTLPPAQDDATVNADQMPALDTVKTATIVNFESPGDVTTYDYVVTNTGNVTITAPITVTDNLISNVTCPALPAGGLAPTASITCTGTYTATQADLDNGSVTNLASASDGTTSSPQTSETIPADQDPALSIVKTALFTDFTAAGDVVDYEFEVTNTGNLTLTGGIDVVDDKIGTITCVTGNLVPGASQTCTASYTITQADMDAGEVTNQAYAQNGSIVSPPDDVTVDGTQDPSMTFDKRATSSTFTDAGDVLTYEFDVENTGNVTITGVSIADSLTTVSCPQTTLIPAETMLCTASYTVTQMDVDAGDVVNNAALTGTAPDGSSIDEDDTETVDSTPNPSLSFDKRALDTSFTAAGDILNYEFDVENDGSVTLSNIVITDNLTTVSCPQTTLAPAQTMVCTASYSVTQADVDAGSVTNSASAGSDLPDGTPGPTEDDDAIVDADINPSWTVQKDAVTPDYAAVGDTLDYTYLVANTGNVTINNIVVTDNLIPSLSCPATTLAPAATLTCTGTYTVTQADIDAGSVTNIADANGDPAGGSLPPATDDETVDAAQAPSLEVVKTALTTDYNNVGDTIDYEYVVTNTGNVTLTAPITVNDNLIPTVNCPALPSGGLLPAGTLTCTATYVVTQADIDAGSVTNTASATDGTTSSPDVDETVNADQMPELTLVKTATDLTYALPGDLLNYTYEVINSGNTTLTSPITVTDNLIPVVNCPALPSGGLLPAASLTCTGVYTVTQADIDAGSVTNIANASDGTTTSPDDDATVNADQNPSFGFVKTATSINFETPGDITTYQYVVTNTGNTTITSPITVTDNLIPVVTCPALPAGGLAPTATLTCTATYTVTQTDLDIGNVTNVASASDGTTDSSPDSETIPADGAPALTMRKSSSDTGYTAVGDVLTYTFELENTGNLTLTGDTNIVDDKIGTFLCYSGNLAPGQVETCTETYTVTQADIDAGSVTNNAFAQNPDTTSPPDDVTIDAGQTPEISMVKTALTTSFSAVGDTLDYEFVVTNSGNTTIIFPVSVTDSRIPNVNCPALPAGGLLPAASLTCTGSDTVTQADIDAGSITNTASATDGTTTSPDETETVAGEQTGDFTIDKVAQSSDFAAVGDILSYDYIVRNTGNVTLLNAVTIVDDKIGTFPCPALPSGGLVPGNTLTCSATYIVTQADIDAGQVTNVAYAESGGEQSGPDDVTVNGTQAPGLDIAKSTNTVALTSAGQTVIYSYLVTNTGNVTVTSPITVNDDKIDPVTCPAVPAGGLVPGAALTCSASYTVTQADMDQGFVTNIATATDGNVTSGPDSVTVITNIDRGMSVVKTATVQTFSTPGDIISYDYVVTNEGNISIIDPITVSDDKIPSVICPALPAGGLAPGASLTCTGDYAVTQADVDAGSVTNIASATDGNTSSPDVSETVDSTTDPVLFVTKTTVSSNQLFGPIFEVEYELGLENQGNVTLSAVTLQDDLAAAFAPATLFGTPVVQSTDFSVDTNYDGVSLIDLLTGTDSLAVGESGVLTLTARLDITNGGPAQGNTAYGNAGEIQTPVPSDDPNVTPGTDGDINPAPLSLIDTDGDGSPDNFESGTADRDGDGIPDSQDYDPTGYFYCEENGDILPGGSIAVTGPAGENSAVGLLNNINIVQDGSNGYFQFYVTEPGLYTLTPTYPPDGEPSTTRLVAAGPLDVSTRSDNPVILGGSEVGTTGVISDFTAGANTPFYFEFDIEAGDPSVLLNNIPLQSCGVPQIDLAKSTPNETERTDDGRQLVSYEFVVTNTGQTSVGDLAVTDDLASVFGAANLEVQALALTDAPQGFTGNVNASYDGVSDIDLLSGTGELAPGESLTLTLDVLINAAIATEYSNRANVTGEGPLATGAVNDSDTATVALSPSTSVRPNQIRVTKSAQPRTVQIGDPVLYTITVTNEGASTLTGIDIVDRLPQGFAYVPGTSFVTDGASRVEIEPNVRSRGVLSWSVDSQAAAPLDALQPNETVSVTLRLLAGPNVTFGAHENQAFAENTTDGTRSDIATAVVDYIPEPSFDCTPVIGRVYDDVNVNGYPDDGEPGLPGVRLVTVNGDIITTDEYGRYHIPCAAIADAENGSNFLLKTDTRTLPIGYAPTTENPRVVRVTRGKFVKMNFGAGYRTKLRVDFTVDDFNADGTGISRQKVAELQSFLAQNASAERAVLVYHAEDSMNVDAAQARLQTALDAVHDLRSSSLQDIALEALWGNYDEAYEAGNDSVVGEADGYEHTGEIAGELFGPVISDEPIKDNGRRSGTDRRVFAVQANGDVAPIDRDDIKNIDEERRWNRNAGLRNGTDIYTGGEALEDDERFNRAGIFGRRDRVEDKNNSARPGRLQRWLGWGNAASAYVDAMEIETTVDSLDPVKRLNAKLDVVSENGARVLKAATYSNYVAFAKDLEIRVFDARRSARGEPILVMPVTGNRASLALPEGLPYELQYVLRAQAEEGSFDQTAPKLLRIGDPDFDLSRDEWIESASGIFGQNTLESSNVRVRGGAVRVYGRNVPGKEAIVMGETVRIDPDGRFVAEQLLPAGDQSITVKAGLQTLVRSVDVKSRDTFYVAQVEATIGERIGSDEIFEEGRVAFYVRSRLNDRWSVTATADTGEAGLNDIVSTLDDKDLDQLLRRLDPDRYYPTYGDNSVIEQDAPTSGRIYARIERDDDYALWGNYQTNFNDTEYARVNRTLYGAKLNWDENAFTTLGDARTEVTAYIAEGGSRQARDELRGTGGSVYYLRHGDISIGSEQIRIETRDSVSGLVIESRRLTYGTDYDLDFIQGRVILTRPLGSSGDDGRLFRDGELSGNAQVLVADYEFTPVFGANDNGAVYGARAKRWFGDHVKLGATYNHSDDGGVESDLYELDLTLQYAAGTYIKGEVARSEGIGVETFTSLDGGFTYNAADRGGLVGIDDVSATAYAIEAAVNFAEISKQEGTAYAYWRKRQAGFAGYAEATNQAVEQFGGGLDIALARGLDLGARADISDSELIGTNSFAEARLDYEISDKTSVSAGLSYTDDVSGNSGTSVGVRVDQKIGSDSKVYAYGQAGLTGDNTRTTDRIGAGGEVRLSKTLFGGGEVSTGEDGLGVRASLRREEEDGDEYYLAYDLPLRAQPTGNFGTLNVGARKRFTDALSVFGEERLQFNDRGLNGLTHAYGVDWSPGNFNLGFSGELGRIDNLDREALALSTGFSNERFKAGFAAEWREDENIDTNDERQTWLLRFTSQYQASEELRLQGKFNHAVSSQTQIGTLGPVDFNEAEFTEGSIAAAYRPIWDDRFNLLAKYTFLEDLSPTSQRFGGEELNYRQRSEIVSIDTAFDVSPKWTLGGKYAHRSGSVTSSRQTLDFTESSADLGVLRLDYHLTHKWDAHLEGRYLDVGNGVITRLGGQAGIYRHMNDNAKLGIGLTWGGIDEQYLGALEDEDDIGWYLNLVGKF